jgi:hypothetical protein
MIPRENYDFPPDVRTQIETTQQANTTLSLQLQFR